LEFVNPNTTESNTTGSNIGYMCDWTVPTNLYKVSVVIVGGGGSGGARWNDRRDSGARGSS
jgi:hypothetical protein